MAAPVILTFPDGNSPCIGVRMAFFLPGGEGAVAGGDATRVTLAEARIGPGCIK